jgi:predicted nucleic acid-binding protein
VLACALAAQARLIVSRDKDLLDLHPYQGIPILVSAEALQHLDAKATESSAPAH